MREMELVMGQDQGTEKHLWRVVIARTIQDWLSNSLRDKRDAEQYLFQNSADLSLVCESAGINVERMRKCLNKVRGRKVAELVPLPLVA
jgi:hypothetical protein